jgi:formate dehydrogenase major subunit/formate dehydrogenase alpha subunit
MQNRDVWNIARRGFESKLVAGADQFLQDARCESCGQCVAYCPVGALYDKMSLGAGRANQITKVRTTCSYCGVGCNFDLNVRNGKVVRVTSAKDAPVNGMATCVKGRYGYDYVHHPDRLTRPMVRAQHLDPAQMHGRMAAGEWRAVTPTPTAPRGLDAAGEGRRRRGDGRGAGAHPVIDRRPSGWVEVDWDTALDIVAGKMTQVKRESGADAIAVLASAKCTNEENYLVNKLTRQVIGTHNIDHCARL